MSGHNSKGYCVKLLSSCTPTKCSLQNQICSAPECQFLCPHMYMCDNCYDYDNGYLCKHIHRVHSLVMKGAQEHKNNECTITSHSDLDKELTFAESVFDPLKGKKLSIIFYHSNILYGYFGFRSFYSIDYV